MNVIREYLFLREKEPVIETHAGAEFLGVEMQSLTLHVWARVNTDNPIVKRRLFVTTTDEEAPPQDEAQYIGGLWVDQNRWHLFAARRDL